MKYKYLFIFLLILFLSFEVSFAFSSLDVECVDIKESQNGLISILLPGDAQGNVTIFLDNQQYEYNINESNVSGLNGMLSMQVSLENLSTGRHYVKVCYENMTVQDSFEVEKTRRYSFNSTDLIKNYGSDTPYEIQVLADGKAVGPGKNVTFFINGVNYTRTTDSEGVAKLNINLTPGNYIVFCDYKTFKNYNNIKVL